MIDYDLYICIHFIFWNDLVVLENSYKILIQGEKALNGITSKNWAFNKKVTFHTKNKQLLGNINTYNTS